MAYTGRYSSLTKFWVKMLSTGKTPAAKMHPPHPPVWSKSLYADPSPSNRWPQPTPKSSTHQSNENQQYPSHLAPFEGPLYAKHPRRPRPNHLNRAVLALLQIWAPSNVNVVEVGIFWQRKSFGWATAELLDTRPVSALPVPLATTSKDFLKTEQHLKFGQAQTRPAWRIHVQDTDDLGSWTDLSLATTIITSGGEERLWKLSLQLAC